MARSTLGIVILVTSTAVVPAAIAQAPNYQAVRVDLVGYYGYAPSDHGVAHGFGLALEPKYNLTDNLALGLRLDAAVFISEEISVKEGNLSEQVSLSQGARTLYTFLAKADYYLTTSYARPFVGLGAGLYRLGAGTQKLNAGTSDVSIRQSADSFTGFGFCPQLGVNIGGFRLALAYHIIIGGKSTVVSQSLGTGETTAVKPSYNFFSFEIGGTFGGNRREPVSAPGPYYYPPAPGPYYYPPASAPYNYPPGPAPYNYPPAPAPSNATPGRQ